MNPKSFGKLIAYLRKHQRDEDGQPYTQKTLAQKIGVSPAIISNIERGEKVTLEADILPRLAQALRLSRRERREFLLASVRIDEQKFIPSGAEESLQKALNVLKTLALPAFLVDTYDNLLAVNHSLLALFPYSESLLQEAAQQFAGYNLLRFVFSQNSPFRESLVENRAAYLQQSIAFFQTMTLPWRATRYYNQLLTALNEAPDMQEFRAYFTRSVSNTEGALFEDVFVCLRHKQFGELKFFSPPLMPLPSAAGNLYLVAYLPASPHSAHIFNRLTQQRYGQISLLQSFPVAGYDEEEDWTSDKVENCEEDRTVAQL